MPIKLVTGYADDILNPAQGFVESGGTYTLINVPDALYTTPVSLNDSGLITGTFFDPSGAIEGFVATPATTPVPEPSTWSMMLVGFASLGYVGVRARRKIAAPLQEPKLL